VSCTHNTFCVLTASLISCFRLVPGPLPGAIPEKACLYKDFWTVT
jgi:hypothetical protein